MENVENLDSLTIEELILAIILTIVSLLVYSLIFIIPYLIRRYRWKRLFPKVKRLPLYNRDKKKEPPPHVQAKRPAVIYLNYNRPQSDYPAGPERVLQPPTKGLERKKLDPTVRFIGKGERLELEGLVLDSPLLYFAEGALEEREAHVLYGDYDYSFGPFKGNPSTRSPLSRLSPDERGGYLIWLAQGRSQPKAGSGYLALYFRALEYRALKERRDLKEILEEVMRLYRLYHSYSSLCHYMESLFTYLVHEIAQFTQKERAGLKRFLKELPLYSVAFRLGTHFLVDNYRLTDKSIFITIANRKETYKSVIPTKLGELFYGYFLLQGRPLFDNIKREARFEKISFTHNGNIPFISLQPLLKTEGKSLQLSKKREEEALTLWNSSLEDLKEYSKRVHILNEDELYIFLPAKLKELYPHPLSDKFKSAALKLVDRPCRLNRLCTLLKRDYKGSLTKTRSDNLATTLEELGYAIEPDSRLQHKVYSLEESAVIYPLPEINSPIIKENYLMMVQIFNFMVIALNGKGPVEAGLLQLITDFIIEHLAPQEELKLRVNKRALLAKAGGIRALPLKRMVDHLSRQLHINELFLIGGRLFEFSAAGGTIKREQIKLLKMIFEAFDLRKDYFDSLLVRYSDCCEQEKAPSKLTKVSPPQKLEPIEIDHNRLRDIMEETSEVQQLLGTIFDDKDSEELPQPLEIAGVELAPFTLPPELEGVLQELLLKESWTKTELRGLVMERGLMFDNTLDELNYWCEEQTGDYLLNEESGGYRVKRELLKGK